MVLGGLVVGIGLIVYLVIRTLHAMFSGEPPALDAMGGAIPPAILDSARSLGFLTNNDSVVYVFARHGDGVRDALIITTRDLIIARHGTPRRYSRATNFDINLNRVGQRAAVLLRYKGTGQVDTLYDSITGIEMQNLAVALRKAMPD
jgi:hypothetical protein